MRRAVLVIALALVVQGCATPYQPYGRSGGYSETRLDSNVFRITFNGNAFTRSNRVVDFTLLRSAELALAHGFKYFVVIDQQRENTYSGTYTTADTPWWYSTSYVTQPSASNTILCHEEKPDSFAYNAEFIYNEIRRKYGL